MMGAKSQPTVDIWISCKLRTRVRRLVAGSFGVNVADREMEWADGEADRWMNG